MIIVMSQQPLDYRSAQPQALRRLSLTGKILPKSWPVPLVLAALAVFGLWDMFGLHVDEGRPGSPAEVTAFTSIPPPRQATKIWVASFEDGGGWGFSHYVRFEAPPAICCQYAAAILPGIVPSGSDNFHPSLDPDIFKSMSWFDLGNAVTLIGASGRNPRPNIHVWIDTTRGVFYFMETD